MPPAARVGDLTAHGTPLGPGPGSTTVIVGGKPAWRAATDTHACPLAAGGAPHGSGVVATGSPTVLIEGFPAATMGDVIAETTGTNTVMQGSPTVLIGGGQSAVSADESDGTTTTREPGPDTTATTATGTTTPTTVPETATTDTTTTTETETETTETTTETETETETIETTDPTSTTTQPPTTPGDDIRIGVGLLDGRSLSIGAVEGDGPVGETVFDDGSVAATSLLRDLATADATVSFFYRDTGTGEMSFVVVHDAPGGEDGTGGTAVMAFTGATGREWQVRADGPGEDLYRTPEEPLGAIETAIWTWPAGAADGAALGPLGGERVVFNAIHAPRATIGSRVGERDGLERWVLVDGATGERITIADFEQFQQPQISIAITRE